MLNKINNQINEFTSTIKEAKGCDDMMAYINSNSFAIVKLLMFASSSFSLYFRLMLFFVISVAGLLMSSGLGVIPVSTTLLLGINIFSLAMIILFVSTCKDYLITSINKTKDAKLKEEGK